MENLLKDIVSIIEKLNPYVEIEEGMNLLDDGVIDSLAIFALITELEDAYDIIVDEDDITRENFETIDNIAELVKKLAG